MLVALWGRLAASGRVEVREKGDGEHGGPGDERRGADRPTRILPASPGYRLQLDEGGPVLVTELLALVMVPSAG